MDELFFIALYPNSAVYHRDNGPNRRHVHLLVWLKKDEHVHHTFECHRRLMPQHVMEFLVEVVEASNSNSSYSNMLVGPPVASMLVRVAESNVADMEAGGGMFESDSDYVGNSNSSRYERCECGFWIVVRMRALSSLYRGDEVFVKQVPLTEEAGQFGPSPVDKECGLG
ncbi:hypothetical protein PIB30_051767 [Stylosanthes scabra]|uniref:Uncharacterized protein n=1 Tax=Stylosanthes scabra TaxID=79078 RepID=A0ABU6WID8_9FABA|nr:hypothetical protein [Stylosanthes scabra]